MTTHGWARSLSRPETTPECHGLSPSRSKSGKGDVGETFAYVMTSMSYLDEARCPVVSAAGVAATTSHRANVAAVGTGRMKNTWRPQPVWRATFPCAL
eukprot:4186000-Amphidinium_carterae.1